MGSYDRCTRCVLSAGFPRIEFDAQGECNFCRDEMIATSTQEAVEAARSKVTELFDEVRGVHPYDAILCNSGGKDSSYTLKLAVEKYGLRVLSFTLDNGFLSPAAARNIERVVDTLGVDHLTLRPSKGFYSGVIKAAALHSVYDPKTLTRISSGCNACISLVHVTALRLALEQEVPLILAGFTLGQIPANGILFRNHYRFLEDSRRGSLDKLREHVGPQVDNYYCISESLLSRVKSYPHNVNLLCLEELTEEEIIQQAQTLGWKAPGDVDGCSTNCQLNTFNNFVHEQKFGFNPYELELSHLIRKGLMTRDEALHKIADQPLEQLGSIAGRLELSESERETLGLNRPGGKR